jgi:hypothetical protein
MNITNSVDPKAFKLECSEVEKMALHESTFLLRFAAEHVQNIDKHLIKTITEARAAAENNAWTPEVAQHFWASFGKLCTIIKLTTMNALEATSCYLRPGLSGWILGKRNNVSLV